MSNLHLDKREETRSMDFSLIISSLFLGASLKHSFRKASTYNRSSFFRTISKAFVIISSSLFPKYPSCIYLYYILYSLIVNGLTLKSIFVVKSNYLYTLFQTLSYSLSFKIIFVLHYLI